MIDLHIHTTSSDGSDEPEIVLKKSEEAGLRYISITDHDSLGAYDKLEKLKISDYFSGVIIPGCEFSVVHEKMPIEVLGYDIDLEVISQSGIISDEWFLERENGYIAKAKEICKNLGLKLSDSLCITSGKTFATQRIHADLRKYPENKKYFPSEIWESINAFYRTCINNESSPFFLNQVANYPDVREIASLIKKAGGKSFLAHLYGYFSEDYSRFLNSLISLHALDGLECYHSLHSPERTAELLAYCNAQHLYASGGSDYHGTLKPNVHIGESADGSRIPLELLKPWLKAFSF